MCILADEVGLAGVSVAAAAHAAHCRIHRRAEVRVAHVALVVDEAVVELANLADARSEVACAARLVAERPEDNARVVAVAHHHAHLAVVDGCAPCRVRGEVLVEVALHVRLVHSVQTVSVEHGVHLRLARIVRSAHGVHVSLLHHLHIAQHGLHVDGASVFGVSVLSVHTLEEHALAVDVHEVAVLLDVAEAVLRREHHLVGALGSLLLNDNAVEIRVFGAPCVQTAELADSSVDGLGLRAAIFGCSRANGLAFMVEQFDEELLRSLHAVAVVHLQRHLQRAACSVLAEVGRSDIMVGNEHLRSSHEIDVAVYAREVPHVLTFEIRAVAPAVDAYRKLVVAHLGEVGDVEFGIGVRVLRVAYVLAVHPYHGSTVHAVEVDEETFAIPRFGHVERAAVEAYGVVVLHTVVGVAHVGVRRIVLERIAHVGVYRSAVACHLPRERHADVVPCRVVVVGSEELAFARTILCSGHELELPLAVE